MSLFQRSRVFTLGLLLTLFSSAAIGAGLDARLDRTRIAEGDTVTLTLSAPGEGTGSPDLSPLAQAFDVVQQSQSTRLQVINGRTSSSREWQLTLAPKRTGQLKVPVLHLGSATSEPLGLEVLPAAQAAKSGAPRPVILETNAEPDTPYVQGKVVYTVRLLASVPLRQASLTDPIAADAIVERLGEDKHFDTYRDGQSYKAIERRYAIFPQHSGPLEIGPPLLTAQIPEPGRRGSSLRDRMFGGRDPIADFDRIFGSGPLADMGGIFEQTRPVQLRGRLVTLDVQARPVGSPTPWLPAESLTLNESWSPNPPTFRVGEPVTRTLVITAQGLTAAQLPDLAKDTVSGFSVYPDKAQTETRADGETLVAQKVIKTALVPSQTGRVTLPQFELAWWNTLTNEAQVARIPAREIQVLPAAPGAAPLTSVPGQDDGSATVPEAASSSRKSGVEDLADSGVLAARTGFQSVVDAGFWPWLAATFALAWLVSTGLWWRSRSGGSGVKAADSTAPVATRPDFGKATRQLESACRNNDPKAAREALLIWAAAVWPQDPPQRLEDIARRLPAETHEALAAIDRVLYAVDARPWDGADAWQQFSPVVGEVQNAGARRMPNTPLPPLYPQGA
ncbi:MAG: protein BatD [Chromatiaceae bacterium]|nr:protein BatD [Chromatiaceae bacterium]MCP5314507.1 protein BatD [Chromatiaceae bacterium]